jgi:hypothetical protein
VGAVFPTSHPTSGLPPPPADQSRVEELMGVVKGLR